MTTRTHTNRVTTDATQLFSTKNDLPADNRAQIASLLNQRLADAIDLHAMCKQAHWNVKGPSFFQLHKLFDKVAADVDEYVDLIAERVVQLGGTAEGTAAIVVDRSTLTDYPLTLVTGDEHVDALSDALGEFARTVRIGVEEMNELEDEGSADILIEVLRGVDKWLWFVEAHRQGPTMHEIVERSDDGGSPARARPHGNGDSASRRARRGNRRGEARHD